jgi:hypothetical protein
MRARLLMAAALGASLLIGVAGHRTIVRAAQEECARACLNGLVDQYLTAIVAHDPSRLPLAKSVKFTEDGVGLKPGDGLWATASGLGTYKLYFDEPANGEADAFAVVQENGTPALLALRLKVVHRQITEIETLVARKQTTAFLNTDALTEPRPIFLETVPPADRPSRQEMISIVAKYFEGIEQSSGDIVPFDRDCLRIENGIQTTNVTSSSTARLPGAGGFNLLALGCRDQFNTKIFSYIQTVSPRRFPIVDSERGLVLAMIRFNHPGTVQSIEVPGRGKVSMGRYSQWPNSTAIAELFKVKDRKIREITAVIATEPYKAPTGWE